SFTSVSDMVVDEAKGKLYVGRLGPGLGPRDNVAIIDVTSDRLLGYLLGSLTSYLALDTTRHLLYYTSANAQGSNAEASVLARVDVATDMVTLLDVPGYANLNSSVAVNPTTGAAYVLHWTAVDPNFFVVAAGATTAT